jgi:hypothetical protein
MGVKKRLTLIGPKRAAKAMCCSGVSFWSRKKITPYCAKLRRISSKAPGAIGAARSMPRISAPRPPESGCTSIELLRMAFAPLHLGFRPWCGR